MSRPVRILALSLAAAAPFPLDAQTEQRTIRAPHVAIYNLVGELRAVAGEGDAVQVEITRRGTDADQLRIETGPIRGRETLRVVYPSDRIVYTGAYRGNMGGIGVRDDGTFSDGDWRELGRRDRVSIRSSWSGLEAHAEVLVRVPRGQRIELFLAVGRIEVANVNGHISVDAGAAEVDVAGASGSLFLDTGSGRVTVRDVAGDVEVDAGSGGVRLERVKGTVLRLDSGSGGIEGSDIEVTELSADVGSGGMRFARVKAPRVDVETGSGGATLELLSDVERLIVESGSGGITVRAPATLSAEVDIETGSGGFHTDFAITTNRMSRDHVQGRIGDGKGRVDIESGSGTVRLLKNGAGT